MRGFNSIFEDTFPGFFDDGFIGGPVQRSLSAERSPRPRRDPRPATQRQWPARELEREPEQAAQPRLNHRQVQSSDVQRETKCSICLEEFTRGESVCELPCKHIFHDACVREWLKREPTCPVCRKEVAPRHERREQQHMVDPFALFAPFFFIF
jgi:hypothetical protein